MLIYKKYLPCFSKHHMCTCSYPPRGQALPSLSLSHTHTYIDTHTQAHIHMYTHTHKHRHTQTYIYTYTHIHIDTHTYTHTHRYMHIHTDTHIHTYTYMHTHTHRHTHSDPLYFTADVPFKSQGGCWPGVGARGRGDQLVRGWLCLRGHHVVLVLCLSWGIETIWESGLSYLYPDHSSYSMERSRKPLR